ncbi:hypothetical protein OH76DRAFT_1108085 [Lentinus brumalis]|uniref:Uncharacterized protein n=1 Tax=Lentinus brumalis TaxID=2498619 RepID=A0A371CVI6_9APHY|nr:hypothetical protein OH76DRAFT_1108085 [Polyporus brumalis]
MNPGQLVPVPWLLRHCTCFTVSAAHGPPSSSRSRCPSPRSTIARKVSYLGPSPAIMVAAKRSRTRVRGRSQRTYFVVRRRRDSIQRRSFALARDSQAHRGGSLLYEARISPRTRISLTHQHRTGARTLSRLPRHRKVDRPAGRVVSRSPAASVTCDMRSWSGVSHFRRQSYRMRWRLPCLCE